MSMNPNHQFITQRLDLARQYGRNAGRFIEKLIYFTASNRINEKNIFDGKCWVYVEGGYKKIVSDEVLPEMSVRQLGYLIASLLEQEIIEASGKMNKFAWDKTYRYCLNEKIFQKDIIEMMSTLSKKKYNKTATKTAIDKEVSTTQIAQKPAPLAAALKQVTPLQTQTTTQTNDNGANESEIERKFKKLAAKNNIKEAELESIGTTAFDAHFLNAFAVAFKSKDFDKRTLTALREIILKASDNLFVQNGKMPSAKELLWELDWLLYAVSKNEYFIDNPDRFDPKLINKQFKNRLAEGSKLKKEDSYKKSNEKRKRSNAFSAFIDLFNSL